MSTRAPLRWLAALALGVLQGARSDAQTPGGTSVIEVQPLAFGVLLPGVPEVVRITDVARRATLALAGSGTVHVRLVLPHALVASGGGSIPLRFRTGDAGVVPSLGGAPVPLNPNGVNRLELSPDRALLFLLGGSAFPSQTQRAGHYSARVVVMISQPGT
jgi:hypothetical protein